MPESSPDTAATGNTPWWESTPVGAPVLLAFVKLDRAGSTREWQELSDADVFRRRAQYVAGVEYVADKLEAAQPLQWQGDGVMLFFKGDERQSAVTRAVEAAEAIRERIIVDLALQVRIAVHAAVVAWDPETGKLAHPAIDLCGHLEHATPVNGISVTEDVYLALPEPEQQRFAPLGMTVRDGLAAYVFPAGLAARKDPESFKPSEDLRLRESFRRYVGSPEIRRLRYVGFPLQKKQPPSLDIREVFIAPEARVRARQGLGWAQTIRMLRAGIGLPGDALEESTQKQVEAPLPPEPISKLLGQHRAMVVLGDPGSGKTTVLRWLAVLAAGGPLAWAKQLGSTERLLPLMLSVGRLAEIRSRLGEVCSVTEALSVYFYDRNVGGTEELRSFLERQLEAGECLVLLDGLDEVRSESRSSILHWLETFCAQFPLNRFVISARRVGYTGFSLPEGAEVELGAFSDEQIRLYVQSFERACRRWENNGVPDDVGADHDSERLLKALFDNPRLRELARNPFLLSSLSLIHRAEGRLPRHRVQAYEIFARTLCETWGNARRVVAGETNTRDIRYEEEAIPILGELALRMHLEWPTGVAPENFVIQTLAEAIRARDEASPQEAERSAKEFLERAGKEVQILLERGAGQWGFLHLTFQEFFTAVGLLSSERFEEVAFQHLFDPRWEEALRLGVGYMALIQKRAQATQRFIHEVLTYEASGSQQYLTKLLRKQIYLAALFASEAGDVLPMPLQEEIAQTVVEWHKSMPESVAEPLLRELAQTEFAERILDASLPELRSDEELARERAVAVLGALGRERTQQALSEAVNDPSSKVRSRVCSAIPSMTESLKWATLDVLARDSDESISRDAITQVITSDDESKRDEILASILHESRTDSLRNLFRILALGSIVERGVGKQRSMQIRSDLLRQALQKGIHHEDEGVRKEARFLLLVEGDRLPGEFAEPAELTNGISRLIDLLFSTTPVPTEALKSQNNFIRIMALAKLIRLKDERAASAAIELSKSDRFESAQSALHFMGLIHDERIKAVLLESTRSPHPATRAAALSSLGELHAREAEEIMLRSLRDPNYLVRDGAIQGLHSLESHAAIKPLVQIAQKSSSATERQEAISALWALSAKAVTDTAQGASAKTRGTTQASAKKKAPARKKAPAKKRPARKH